MDQEQRPAIGMDVVDNADHLVGTVETVEHDHFIVQKGFFFPQSHRLPISAIDSIEENEVTLRISLEVALASNVDADWKDSPQHGESVPDASQVTNDAFRSGVDPRKSS